MKNALYVALILAAALPASADPRNPKPDWIDGPSAEFPREQYVVGVGLADDRATAEERARGEIAKVFSSNITVDSRSSAVESSNNGTNAFSQSVSQEVKNVSKKALEGVQLTEHWQDGTTKVHYALAVLDRAKARAALSDKISDLDKQALQWHGQMGSAADKLGRAKAAMKLLTVLKAREELNSELRVVADSGKGADAPFDESKIRPEAAKAIAALDVVVDFTGTGEQEIETALVKGLAAFGIQSKIGSGKDADVAVTGKLDTKPMDGDGSRWKWARSTATISVKDARTGKVVSQFDASDREASADYQEAARRTRVELAKRVSDQIATAITAYFENN